MQTLRRGETLRIGVGLGERFEAKFLRLNGNPRGGVFQCSEGEFIIFSAELSAGWVTIERTTQTP